MRPYYGRMESEVVEDDRDDYFEDDYEPEDDLVPCYVVQTNAYCGMKIPHGEFETEQEALERVDQRIMWLDQQGSKVYKLGPREWEVGEPEDCVLVPDFCGTITIKEIFK